MTLGQWLQEATGTFPHGVRERLAQDYKAHLDDSVASGRSGDALELFGNPQMVAKDLTRLYVTSDRLKLLEEMPRGWYRYLILVSLWAPAYSLSYRASALRGCLRPYMGVIVAPNRNSCEQSVEQNTAHRQVNKAL